MESGFAAVHKILMGVDIGFVDLGFPELGFPVVSRAGLEFNAGINERPGIRPDLLPTLRPTHRVPDGGHRHVGGLPPL